MLMVRVVKQCNGFSKGALFAEMTETGDHEKFETLVASGNTRIERIVSTGQSSPPGFWYDQDEEEFVLLVAGAATLRIEGQDDLVRLKPGDWVNLPAHRRHRVESTSNDEPTIWLAVFTKPDV